MSEDPRIETGSLARQLPEEAHLVMRFSKFQDFVDEYSSRISLGGIFVRHDQLRPVGSQVYLDFRLEDDYRLFHGIGEVVWVRLKTMSEERPKGMGVRFASLDEDGRELVLKLLEEQVKGGGEPFEVDRVPEDGSIDPSVVQAMEGPSSEETQAAEQAKTAETAAREATPAEAEPDEEEDDEELPDLPPGVLPPPDEEPDFSAPWGENLPEIPGDLLDESKNDQAAAESAPDPSPVAVPSVEAPESPYEPGSKDDAAADAVDDAPDGPGSGAQAELELTASDTADPVLDESDFGMPKDDAADEAPEAPDEAPAPAAGDEPWEPEDFAAAEDDETSFDAAAEEPSFDAPSFESPSFDTFEEPDGDSGDLGAAGFDLEDETSSAVAPPEDMGDAAGAAFSTEFEPSTEIETATEGEERAEEAVPPPAPELESEEAPEPERVPDIGGTETNFEVAAQETVGEPEAAESVEEGDEGGVADGDRFDGDETAPSATAPPPAADSAMDAAFDLDDEALGGDGFDQDPAREETATAEPAPVPTSAGATQAEEAPPASFAGDSPAISPADQAVSALPDLSDTVMGTKSPEPEPPPAAPAVEESKEAGEETWQEGAYDDWEDWAPQPASQGKVSFLVVVAVLVLAGLGIAGYLYQDELLELVVGESSTPAMSGGPATGPQPPVGMDPQPGDPAATPEGVEPVPRGADPAGSPDPVPGDDPYGEATASQAEELVDLAEEEPAGETSPQPPPEEATTRASADDLRPPDAGADSAGDVRSSAAPAQRITEVDVSTGSRGTVVSIRFDGFLESSRYLHDPLAWATDREMVTLYGVENHPQTVIDAGTTELRRIRVGFHPGPELRLVFDLAGEGVTITSVEDRGDLLRVRLGR